MDVLRCCPGAWELRAYAGRDAPSGRKRYKTKTVRLRGRREAEKALAAFVTELETSGVAADGTFGELVERWIATAVPGWSPANEVTVRNTVSYYLGPLLPVKLSKLNTADLDAFYAALRNGGATAGPWPSRRCGGGTRWSGPPWSSNPTHWW